METEFRIKIPEGMEIDKEHSTFECIRFKPKKVSYEYIQDKLYYTRSINTCLKHYSKCDTFKKLLEVADYLNGDWKPDWFDYKQNKYIITYNTKTNKLEIDSRYWISVNAVYFSSKENAQRAIEIIGEEELKQFFL